MARVMIVDDNFDMRELLAAIVSQAGHDPITASGAEDALSKMADDPDMIFMDIDMPGGTGVGLVIRLRVSDPGFKTPVVFVSAHPERAQTLKKPGASPIDIVSKPFRKDDIVNALQKHCS